jgi:mRNA-degrading endonuclease toxin of MazEF toxin-antitoxin module
MPVNDWAISHGRQLVDQVHTLDRTLVRKELGAVPADRMRRIAEGLALLLRPDDP